MITIYGIPNCDTIKKTKTWFEAEGIPYRFHDYRKDGTDRATIQSFTEELGIDTVLNRRGTTWRGLSDSDKADLTVAKAVKLMVAHPAMIKRPIIELASDLASDLGWGRLAGFDETVKTRVRAAVKKRK